MGASTMRALNEEAMSNLENGSQYRREGGRWSLTAGSWGEQLALENTWGHNILTGTSCTLMVAPRVCKWRADKHHEGPGPVWCTILHSWSLVMEKKFHPILKWPCDYLLMQGFKLIHNEMGPRPQWVNINSRGPFYWHGLTSIAAWVSKYMSSKVQDESTFSVKPLKFGNG